MNKLINKIKVEPKVVYVAALGFIIGNAYGAVSMARTIRRNVINKK